MMKKVQAKSNLRSGVPGFDKMFNKNLVKGSIILLAGQSGTGKTLFGLQFLKAGLEENEKCIYVSLTEDPFRTLKYFKDLDINWNKYIENKKLILIRSHISKISGLLRELNKIFRKNDNCRLVIDGFPEIPDTCRNNKIKVCAELIINEIKKFNISSVLTSNIHYDQKDYGISNLFLPPLSDIVVLVEQDKAEDNSIRMIRVLKAKGMLYDPRARELNINESGIKIKTRINNNKNIILRESKLSKVTVSMSLMNIFKEAIKEFNDVYSDVKILTTPFIDLEKSENDIFNEKADVDIVTIGINQVQKYVKKDLLMPLEGLANKSIYFDKAVEACSYKDVLYGVPDDISSTCLFYRKDLLQKYQCEVPRCWKEVVETSKYIMGKENDPALKGLLFYADDSKSLFESFMIFVWANGGNIYDKNGKISVSNEKIIEALTFMQDLIWKHEIVNKELPLLGRGKVNTAFREGKSIFMIGQASLFRDIVLKNKIWIAGVPSMSESKSGAGSLSGRVFVVRKNAKYPVSAQKVLKFIADKKTAHQFEIKGGYPFPSIVEFWSDSKILRQKPYYSEAANILRDVKCLPLEIENVELVSLLVKNRIFPVMRMKKTPKDALNLLEKDLKKIKKHKVYEKITENIMQYVDWNFNKDLTLNDISKNMKLSVNYIEKIFKYETGMTVIEYIVKKRIEKAKDLLKDVRYNIGEVAVKVGYPDITYFGKLFKKHTDKTPSEYRLY
ncbi:MAG: hypothetical protein A2452_07105 [Candidatus Firestonebacteria bacterium RIFOXYC2_FULL_39_67]|nr:MAG: hypothetical protein A2536_04765 [Candidatus Firestonebacteria bacterium RIFOXYD2_FULL_39_29]OGF54826.1 MAG: hypothetical protein A2452_07105 [Candidatus Firestonebacteria bacterium RIFOXYC2_FULL_39_67]